MVTRDGVTVVTEHEFDTAVENTLRELGLTMDELRAQAERDEFSSEQARLLWWAIEEVDTS
jgi:hypothetical protein